MHTIQVDTKADQPAQAFECLNCGGHWFPRWLANDISLNVAKNIDSVVPQATVTTPQQPRCPECQFRLSLIQNDSVVRGVTVWACPQGHGNFFPIHDLFNFKTAQEAKITYHQVWGVPIKSVLAVLLPVVAVLTIAAGTPVLIRQVSQSQETRTQASLVIKTPLITQLTPTSTIISFTSTAPMITEITISQDDRVVFVLPVSDTLQTTHTITVTGLSSQIPYSFVIKYTDSTGQSNTTIPYPLTLN